MAPLVPDQIAGSSGGGGGGGERYPPLSPQRKFYQIPTTHPAHSLKLVSESPLMTQVLSKQLPLNCDFE